MAKQRKGGKKKECRDKGKKRWRVNPPREGQEGGRNGCSA